MLNRVTWTAYLGTAVLSLLLVATISGGCTLSRSGELRQECTSAAECILPNACYVSECSETGQCVFTATDNTSVLEQAPDDCGRWECVLADDGTAEPQRLNEDADRPDDVECVTRYECADGELQEFGVGLGTLCGNMDQGVCQDGACVVSCDEAGDPNCDDGNDCTNDICNLTTNECEYEVLDNVDAPAQVDGDCRVVLCALGAETEIYDDLDIYDDGSECTTDTCNQGQPVNTPLPQGTGCTGVDPLASVCDSFGACVQCNADAECIGFMTGWDDTDCQTPVCTAGICELQCEPLGVEAAAQSSQPDCKTTVCDGACGYQDNADDSDVHDDGVDCTQDFCDLGTVSHPPEPLNTPCGASGLCDGNGACGACNLDTDCQSDTFCRDWSCNTAVMPHVCVSADINQGVDLPAGQSDGDCHTVRCNNGLPDDQVDDTDLPVDNEQCTFDECNAGTPTNPPLDIDEPCTQGANGRFCDGSGACVNCNDVTQCSLADGICDNDACNANNCEVEFHSTATNAPASCQSVTPDCQVVKCDGAGECGASVPDDVDVVDDGNECTADSCSGGMEVHDGAPVEGNLCTQNGVFCDGDETCQSGTCSTDTVNPVCPGHNVGPNCNDSCNEGMADCTADDLIDTSCGDPTNDACTAPDTCDGMGTCLGNHAGSGDPCGDQGVECLVDDACDGNGACTDNGAEMAGTSCGDGTDDECTNPDSCDGAGTCLDNHETSGAPCGTQGVECFLNDACDGSGSCTDNGFAMSGSACGDNADTECTDPDTCDGGGTCLDNHAGSGDPCGDQGADCHVDDACDGSGACTDNGFAMIDTSCGDATDDACTDPDTCDATGTCLDNHAASGAPCGDQGVDCHVDDTCNGSGMCTDNGFEMMGTACGDLSDTECTNPDTCDNGGVCLDNHEPATTACGDGVTEPTCDPDHCDAAGGCTDEPDAANGTTCTENGGDVCFTSSCVDARVVFVTSTLYDGDDLGSALDADTECTTRAGAAGLAGSYMAWMSDSTTDPDTRFTQAAVEYLLLDGTRVANNWTDLSNGNLDNAINVDEFGAAVGVAAVWTGTVDDGTASSSYCLDWQSVDNLEEGVVGSTDTSSSGWSDGSTATCDQSLRIFCVEQ